MDTHQHWVVSFIFLQRTNPPPPPSPPLLLLPPFPPSSPSFHHLPPNTLSIHWVNYECFTISKCILRYVRSYAVIGGHRDVR